jgi:GT2 family glycosyltransferase
MATQSISVVVPSYRPDPGLLKALYDSLLSQRHQDFEVVVVDDASPGAPPYALLCDPRFRLVRLEENGGPARARNTGAAAARHDFLFFTDTDCTLAPDCLAQVAAGLQRDAIVSGDTRTEVKTRFGRAVALLGFPGGGALGFHRVWRVDESGRTNSFSSCNLAFRKEVFEALGGFNERFPVAGGEDTVLARRAVERGMLIRYNPAQVVYHVEKHSLRDFLRWQLVRGRGNFYIRRHVPEVGGYLKLRVWTYRNSMRSAGLRYALPVTLLWVISVVYQTLGYRMEARRNAQHGRAAHPG